MKKLKSSSRNIMVNYDKRAICDSNVLLDVINQAIKEKIPGYMLIFAYQQKMYSIGYVIVDNEICYKFCYNHGKQNSDLVTLDSIEQLKSKINFDSNVTVLSEVQFLNILRAESEPETPIEKTINDNYILKPYLVTSDNEMFNSNMNDTQISEYAEIMKVYQKKSKKISIILAGLILFIVLVLIIAML